MISFYYLIILCLLFLIARSESFTTTITTTKVRTQTCSPYRSLKSDTFTARRRPRQKYNTVIFASTTDDDSNDGETGRRKVLVVGGNGRVGGSTARHIHILSSSSGDVELILGGRSQDSFEKSKARILSQLSESGDNSPPKISFLKLDFEDGDINTNQKLVKSIKECGAHALVHTAGPFQTRTKPTLLEACIEVGIPYVDVCDEPSLCATHKELSTLASEKGVVAVTAAGIWPGASALMAAQAIEALEQKKEEKSSYDITMSFFTAGTGNAGATIVSATFLLLCQPALTIVNGKKVEKDPWTEELDIDFMGNEGVKTVRLLDNPDVFTLNESLGNINSLSSRFATSPSIWNQLFGAMKATIPPSILGNTELMQNLSLFSLPIIRFVDKFVGATNAMRVDVTDSKNSNEKCTFILTHDDLEQCVGLATAAFVLELLDSSSDAIIPPGVYYPAELPSSSRDRILQQVKKDSIVCRWNFDTTDV